MGVSETFIQAAIDRLPGSVHLNGFGCNFSLGSVPLQDFFRTAVPRWLDAGLNLLPRCLEFRLRRKWLPEPQPRRSLMRFLQREQVDVVLAEYGPVGASILDVCQDLDLPLVVHFHGFDSSRHSTLLEMNEAYTKLFAGASAIIVVSKRMKHDLVMLGCNPNKIKLIYYGAHPDFFSIVPNYESNNLLMVGRLTDQKAPHLSILAFAKVAQKYSHIRLRIIGDGELRGVCRDLILALGLSGRVDMLGSGGRELVVREFSNSVMFLQHSIEAVSGDREGTPVAILEAGASGLPVVSTRHAGIPDVVTPDTGLLVEEGDIDAMADVICRLIEDRKLASEMGQRARRHVAESFGMVKHIEAVQSALSDVVQSRTARVKAT